MEYKSTKLLTVSSFWKDDPNLWFAILERKFQIHNITTDEIKFNKVIDVLDDIVPQISAVIRNPPLQNKYATIKQILLDIYQKGGKD